MVLLSLSISLISCGNSSTTEASSESSSVAASSVNSQSSDSSIDNSNLDELTTTYLMPATISGVAQQNWTDANDISADSFNAFYLIKAGPPTSSDSEVSENEFETLIQQYFNVSTEHLRESTSYNPSRKTYTIEGIGNAIGFYVTSSKQNGNVLTMEFQYTSPADDSIVIAKGTLTVGFDNNGSYKFTSCHIETLNSDN